MKQYTITKVVYANSPQEAIMKEDKGMVVNISLNDLIDENEFNDFLSRRAQVKNMKVYDKK